MTYGKFTSKADRIVLAAALAIAFTAVGCGGGSGMNGPTGSAGQAGSQTTSVGMAQITYTGRPKPLSVESSGLVSFYGEAGASFSSLTVYPTPNLASTSLLFTRGLPGGDQTYYAPANGQGSPTPIAHDSVSGYCSADRSGLIAYLTVANGLPEIVTSYLDGSHSKVVLSGINGFVAISPNGATIAYINGDDSNLYTIPSAGGTPTEIYNGGNAATVMPVWSPSGNKIAFAVPDSTTPTNYDVCDIAPSGGTVTNITPSTLKGVLIPSAWSPDGNSIACTYTAAGMTTSGVVNLSVSGGINTSTTPTGYNDSDPCFSPDNLHLAFYRTNAGGATPGIYISDITGTNSNLVIPDPPSTSVTGPIVDMAWTYFLENEKFVGSGSTLSDAAVSGLLLTQNGSQFASLMVFGATTPSTATLTTESIGSGGGPSIFKLAANGITIISYANVYNGTQTFLPLSGTTAALVTLDGITGLIDMVAPGEFAKKQPLTTSGGRSTLVYNGKFSGIYDGTGKNLAPMGATTLQIDSKTGKLVSFQ